MQFDTKIAVVIRADLEPCQKLNVAAVRGRIGQPILIYGADRPALTRALEALARDVRPAVYTEEMFKTPTTPPTVPRSRRLRAPILTWLASPCVPSAR
jgi:hypothetical protein